MGWKSSQESFADICFAFSSCIFFCSPDDCGQEDTYTQTITSVDEPPQLTGTPSIDLVCGVYEPNPPTPEDDCTPVADLTLTSSDPTLVAGEKVPGLTPVYPSKTLTWVVTDDCNADRITFPQTLNYVDEDPPVIVIDENSCNPNPPPVTCGDDFVGSASADDNCGGPVEWSFGEGTADRCTAGSKVITNVVTDDNGNEASCDQTFTWEADTEGPAITCDANVESQQCGGAVTGGASATEVCGDDITYNFGTATLDKCAGGTVTVTNTATDVCGQSSTCDQTFSWAGIPAPTLTCGDAIQEQCGASVTGTGTAPDQDCGVTSTVTGETKTLPTTCRGSDSLTVTALSECGSDTCQQPVTWADTTPPTITCPEVSKRKTLYCFVLHLL